MQLKNFLGLILPNDGFYCWVAIKNKKVSQHFTESLDDLVIQMQGADTRGFDVYFACASYKDNSSRKAANAHMAQAVWLDIDAGEGKPYVDAEAALAAVDDFANRCGIPLPVVVKSGAGIHAYWPLDSALPADQWQPAARAFKQLTLVHGLLADPSRTADIASILRPPGTYNWKLKDTPRPVTLEESEEEPELTAADWFLSLVKAEIPVTKNFAAPPVATTPVMDSIAAAAMGGISAGKAPVMTQGYPDGQRTQALLERLGWCFGPWKMPLEAAVIACEAWNGYNQPPLPADKIRKTAESILRKVAGQKPAAAAPQEADMLPKMPWPYKWGPNKELVVVLKADDNLIKEEVISPYALYLQDVCRRESVGMLGTSYIFRRWHPQNGWNEFTIPAEEFVGGNWLSGMARNGVDNIEMPKHFKHYVMKASTSIQAEKMDTVRFEQFGWKADDSAFLAGDVLIKAGGQAVRAYPGPEIAAEMQLMRLPRNGSQAAWSAAANKFYAPRMEPWGFTLISSFAATLIKFVVADTDGGPVLSLYSKESGRGKSSIMAAIASAWGPLNALRLTGKSTEISKYTRMSRLGNLPVLEDELAKRDPSSAGKFIKDFTVGVNRERAQRDGSVSVDDKCYRTILICGGNDSLYECVKMSGDMGAVARIFELALEIPDAREFQELEATVHAMLTNHGYAGRAFMTAIMQPGMLDWVKRQLKRAEAHYRRLLETKPDHRFIAYLMAADAVAAAVLVHAGILDFNVKRIMDWGVERATDRVADTGQFNPVVTLSNFISENTFDCLTVDGPYNFKRGPCLVLKHPTRALRMRLERDTKRLYISADTIKNWCQKNNQPYLDMARQLEEKKVLLGRSRQTTLGAGTDYAPGRVPCWEINTAHPDMTDIVSNEDTGAVVPLSAIKRA